MKKTTERALLFSFLVLLSAGIYYLHYLIFRDTKHIFIYLIGDIAFLPLEILFVSLIFHKLLEDREKKNSLSKLNMIIGVFFSETGNRLLLLLSSGDLKKQELKDKLVFEAGWHAKDFKSALRFVEKRKFQISLPDLRELRLFLMQNRDFMLKIIENPSLLEHELFSELMMSVFHLQEELSSRSDVANLGDKDREHIHGDIARVYKNLLKEWILYTQHLKNEYPYLYSFAVRTNLFDDDAAVEIR